MLRAGDVLVGVSREHLPLGQRVRRLGLDALRGHGLRRLHGRWADRRQRVVLSGRNLHVHLPNRLLHERLGHPVRRVGRDTLRQRDVQRLHARDPLGCDGILLGSGRVLLGVPERDVCFRRFLRQLGLDALRPGGRLHRLHGHGSFGGLRIL